MKAKSILSKNFPRQAILLAAGLGTRLRPLTNKVPKPALPVGGIPILLFNLFLLKKAGIRDITINLHHQPAALKNLLRKSSLLGLRIQWSQERQILGTAGGIAKALRKMRPESTIVLNGDILLDVNFSRMFARHRALQAWATLAVIPPDRAAIDSYVEYDQSGRIFRIAGRPPVKKDFPILSKGIFSGAHVIDPLLFRKVSPNKFSCVIEHVYQVALKEGVPLASYRHEGHWWDLGHLNSLKEMDRSLWEKSAPQKILNLWKEVQGWSSPLFTPQP